MSALSQPIVLFKIRPKTLAFIAFLSLCPLFGSAEGRHSISSSDGPHTWLHHSWTTENGLPQNSISAIVQTHDGYLWLGTFGGLVRFDGVKFTTFDTDNTPQLKSNRIRALYEDGGGHLWIGTEHGGLTEYRNRVFRHFSQADGLPSNVVISLTGDGANNAFAGTTEGVARFDGVCFRPLSKTWDLPRDKIYSIYFDPQGALWLGTESSGLVQASLNSSQSPKIYRALRGKRIQALQQTPDGSLWIGTNAGLLQLKNGQLLPVLADGFKSPGSVLSLLAAGPSTLWVGASGGLFQIVAGRLQLFDPVDNSAANLARSLCRDREGNLWVGSEAAGLQQWRVSSLRSYGLRDGLTDKPVAAIYQDLQKTVWVGSPADGLFTWRDGAFQRFQTTGAQLHAPASLTQDAQGTVWIGDWEQGLVRLAHGHAERVALPGLNGNTVRTVYVDTAGTLWVGTDQRGLYRLDNQRFLNYRQASGLPADTVTSITQHRSGEVWLATPKGISRFDGHAFTNYQSPGLTLVRTLHWDPAGSLWIGTYGSGLFRLKSGQFVRITMQNGLFDSVVSSILEDRHGNFWMSGNRGIYRCSWRQLNDFADGKIKSIHCVAYGVTDGMQINETNGAGGPAAWETADGKFWFALIRGLVVIDPNQHNTYLPPVVIEQTMLNGHLLPAQTVIKVKAGTTNLQIDYAALSFTRPQQLSFRYKLIGLDDDWLNAGSRRTVNYSSLPPGHYQFKVIASNGFGIWNPHGASVRIDVIPPFWRTTWFFLLSPLVLVLAVSLFQQLRLAGLKRERTAQETFSRQLIDSQEKERQRIAAELHDSLGQSLLVIKNRTFLALSATRQADTLAQLNEISSVAAEAIDEVRTIAHNLRPRQLDRFGLTKALRSMCTQAANVSGIHFTHQLDAIDGLFAKEIETSLYRVVQEGVNNIIKHSQASDASFTVSWQEQEVHLRLLDNGCGFAIRPNRSSASSDGFGLLGMSQRVKMMGGLFHISSGPGSGTMIDIFLSIDNGPL